MTFKDCIAKNKIFKSNFALKLIDIEIQDSIEDLAIAKKGVKENLFKWSTIQAYYSLFHSARALIYSRGYREKGRYCLYLALKELFVKEKLLDNDLAEAFLNGMILRENADYKRNFSEKGAKAVIETAERFLKETKKLLKNRGGS